MKRFGLLFCLFIISAGFAVTPQSVHADRVYEYQLKNGLKLIVKADHRAPVAITQVWYKVGSRLEPLGITGISHALEHMMFRGSKNYSAEQFLQTIANNGGQQNAFTHYDYTAYYELMSANKLPLAFKLEADRMRNLSLHADDFAKEIQIVMEERRMRTEDDPQQTTFERFLAAAFIASPYHHTVVGWMSDLQHMTIEDLRKWYQTWYAPNNAIVVVVGDVQPQQVYELAQQYFGPLAPSQLPVEKPQNEVRPLGMRIVNVAVPAKLPYLAMGYNTPTVSTAQEKWEPYALMVLAGILDAGNSGRLEQNLQRGKQIVSDINAGYAGYFQLDNLFTIEAIPAQNHTVTAVENAILDQIKQLQQQPVTAAELARVKAQIIAANVYKQDSINAQASRIGSLEAVGLSWQEDDNMVKQIKKITPAQVQAVAKKYLIAERLTVAILKPLPMINSPQAPLPTAQRGNADVH